MFHRISLLALCLLLLSQAGSVAGHGYIERTDPADGAELATAPDMLRVWFSESLVPGTGTMRLTSGAGETISLENVRHTPDDDTLLLADLPDALPTGAYILTASAVVASDGHEPVGSIVFWVGERQQAAADTTQAASTAPEYRLILLFGGVLGALGSIGLWLNRRMGLAVERPANWENIDHTAL
ncbi:MAG: copper resistance protein CopC [Anaerolineales bacterium]